MIDSPKKTRLEQSLQDRRLRQLEREAFLRNLKTQNEMADQTAIAVWLEANKLTILKTKGRQRFGRYEIARYSAEVKKAKAKHQLRDQGRRRRLAVIGPQQ